VSSAHQLEFIKTIKLPAATLDDKADFNACRRAFFGIARL
jgi:hypothetical protein